MPPDPLRLLEPSALARRLAPPKNIASGAFRIMFFLLVVVRSVILSVTLRRAHEACDMASQASAKTKPSTRLSVFVWKRIFFPPISPTVHLYSVKTITESRIFSKTLSRVKILENAGHSFTCGRTKTQVFEYDDVMHHLPLAWRMLCKGCYRISIV